MACFSSGLMMMKFSRARVIVPRINLTSFHNNAQQNRTRQNGIQVDKATPPPSTRVTRRSNPMIAVGHQVLSAVVPIMGIVAAIQPINAYVYVGDGVLYGSRDVVFAAISMLLISCLSISYIVFRMNWGSGGDSACTLFDVWIGLVIFTSSRSVVFTVRHFLDPMAPLTVEASSESGDGGYGKAPSDEDEG